MYNTIHAKPTNENISLATQYLEQGEVVAFPTETVYGLGANALEATAVLKIFKAKNRPADNPLIVHVATIDQVQSIAFVTPQAEKLISAYWPGPMTLVLKKKSCIPNVVSANLDSVGIRMPSHPVALSLLKACNLPLAAPSANTSTRPSPTTADHVLKDMQGRIPMVLDGGACDVGVESTVIDATQTCPVILRPGAITEQMVEKVCGSVAIAPNIMRPLQADEKALSPGMKHKHYAPKAKMTIYQGDKNAVIAQIKKDYNHHPKTMIFCTTGNLPAYEGYNVLSMGNDANQVAQNLFSLLRQMDDESMEYILAEGLVEEGVGLAVMNRMARAASFDIVHL